MMIFLVFSIHREQQAFQKVGAYLFHTLETESVIPPMLTFPFLFSGIVITMDNINNLVNWWIEFFKVTARDRILLFSSLSFIMSIRQYLPTLCAGGTVVLPRSSVEFESAILHSKVTKVVSEYMKTNKLFDISYINHHLNTPNVYLETLPRFVRRQLLPPWI